MGDTAKRIADKYIGPRGGKPKQSRLARSRENAHTSRDDVTIPLSDYKELMMMAESAPEFSKCESCGAWLNECDDNVYVGDIVSCRWYAHGCDDSLKHTCRRYRSISK